MSIENIVSSGLVSATVVGVAKTAHKFLAAITGHPGEDLPTLVGSWAREYLSNLEVVTNKAHLTLLDLHLEPRVDRPLKILKPIFEGAAAEGDPTLQDRWANLLANAIDPRDLTEVRSMFPYILLDLGHRDVKFLDHLYVESLRKLNEQNFFTRPSQIGHTIEELKDSYVKLGLSRVANLNCASFDEKQSPDFPRDEDAFFLLVDVIQHHDVIRTVIVPNDPAAPHMMPGQRLFHFTELGVGFILACLPPIKS